MRPKRVGYILTGLGLILSLFVGVVVYAQVADATTAADAIAAARMHEPDVVIMDVRLPDGSGIEACRQIRMNNPKTRVVMLTWFLTRRR